MTLWPISENCLKLKETKKTNQFAINCNCGHTHFLFVLCANAPALKYKQLTNKTMNK